MDCNAIFHLRRNLPDTVMHTRIDPKAGDVRFLAAMTPLLSLWLPILLASVFVFVASSVIHMLSPWHKSDYPRVPSEDKVMDALRPLAIPPGDYMVPRCTNRAEMRSPEFLEKMKKGPVIVMTVLPNGQWAMGRNLSLWFVYLLVISFFSAYIAAAALPPGVHYLRVFRFAGAASFIGYSAALFYKNQNSLTHFSWSSFNARINS